MGGSPVQLVRAIMFCDHLRVLNGKGSWTEQPGGGGSRKGALLSPAESKTVLGALFRWAGGGTALEETD